MNWQLHKNGHWILNVSVVRDDGIVADGVGDIAEYAPQAKRFRWRARVVIGNIECNDDGREATLKRAQKVVEEKLKWLADKPKGHCFDFAKERT